MHIITLSIFLTILNISSFTCAAFCVYRLLSVLLPTYVQFFVQLIVLEFQVLIQRSFRPVWSLACIDWTPIMSLDFVCCPPEPLLPIIIASLAFLDLLPFFLQFGKFVGQFVALINKLSHLGKENNIGEIGSAILMIVIEISIRINIGIHSR